MFVKFFSGESDEFVRFFSGASVTCLLTATSPEITAYLCENSLFEALSLSGSIPRSQLMPPWP